MHNNIKKQSHPFWENIAEILRISRFIFYHITKGVCYLCKAPVNAIKCKINYHKSPFYMHTGITKKDFYGGSSWRIGNDHRYIIFNAIAKMDLPLNPVLIENPRLNEEALMYYHIYNDTIIVTHGFYQAMIWDDNRYHIIRNPQIYPEEYGTVYSISEFAQLHWMQFVRPQHRHLPIKVLHSNSRYRFQKRHSDTYDFSPNGIFYRKIRDLKKIFK